MEITLGNIFFPSREKLKKYLSNLLHRGSSELSESESAVVQDFFAMHPFSEEKLQGEKVVGAGVVRSDRFSKLSPSFCIYTDRGREITFSWKKCFCSKEVIQRRRVYEAFRNSIAQFCIDYYNEFMQSEKVYNGYFQCEITGHWYDLKDITVDHLIPLSTVIADWSNENNIDILCLGVSQQTLCRAKRYMFIDKSIENSFRMYHKKHAKLVCTHYLLNNLLSSTDKNSEEAKEIIDKFQKKMLKERTK